MALANLTINIVANSEQAQSGLRGVGDTARVSMSQSSAAVEGFRADMVRTGNDVQASAKQMGANMQAANDAIVSSSARSQAAVDQLNASVAKVDMKSFAEKAADAFGTAFGASYAATQTWLDKTEELVAAKVKIIAIGLAIAAVSATAGVVYGAYRIISGTLGFIEGLFTGDAYKSDNINALIAANEQVKQLQQLLHISAQDASALGDALGRFGLNKSDYSTVWTSATAAMRNNGDELDRLGVRYKDANGKLLDTQAFLQNVRATLETYTVGMDRNAAATAIGAGGYTAITNALKITSGEIASSRDRLQAYNLVIGNDTQVAIERYQQAMRNFANESKLTSEGFKRAIADNIMPVLTDLAIIFEKGFPFAVAVFRYSMATVTSMFYGISTVAEITYEVVKGSVLGQIQLFGSLGTAALQVLQGNFTGAADTMRAAWVNAGTTASKTMEQIVADARTNRDRMIMAWGLDDRTGPGAPAVTGKAWVPAPKPEATAGAGAGSAYQSFLDQLDQQVKKLQENEFASMRLKAAQLAQKEGITDLTAAYTKINAVQAGESQKVVDAFVLKMKEQADAYGQQTAAMRLTSVGQEQLAAATKIWLDVENTIQQAKKSGRPLTDAAIAQLREQAAATDDLTNKMILQRDTMVRAKEFGLMKAVQDYGRAANDEAANAASMFKGTVSRMEDAIVNFAKTGKLNLRDLFSFMAEEFIRQQARMLIAKATDGGLSGLFSSLGSGVSSLAGGVASMFTATPLAAGTNYVPRDNFPALLHEGEAVVPKAFNAAAGGQGPGAGARVFNIDQSGATYNVGQGVSRGEMAAAVKGQAADTETRIRRLMRNGNI